MDTITQKTQGVLSKQALEQGIELYNLKDSKFKHNRISVHMVLPLDQATVTEYAILPFVMRKGYKGCEDFSKLNEMLDHLYGASLITEVGKFGANQVLIYSIQAIDERFTLDNERIIRRCTELLCDVVLNPDITDGAFPEQDVALEKQFLIDTITAEINDKRSYAINRCKLLMGEHNPAAIRKYGYVESAQKITPTSAAAAYADAIRKAHIKVLFIGSGDSSIAFEVIKERFAKLERQPVALNPIRYFAPPSTPQSFTDLMEVSQAKLVMGFRMPEASTPLELTVNKLMVVLYGGTPASKLFMNVREKLSLCYYCAARFDRLTGILLVDSGVELANIELAKEEILRQLEEIRQGIISEEELNSAKLMVKNSLRAVGDSLGSIEEWYLLQSFLGTANSPTQEFTLIDQVTAEMIAKAAQKVALDTVYLLSAKQD